MMSFSRTFVKDSVFTGKNVTGPVSPDPPIYLLRIKLILGITATASVSIASLCSVDKPTTVTKSLLENPSSSPQEITKLFLN